MRKCYADLAEGGPGVWDTHGLRAPGAQEMADLLDLARQRPEHWQIWVNPDRGTRTAQVGLSSCCND